MPQFLHLFNGGSKPHTHFCGTLVGTEAEDLRLNYYGWRALGLYDICHHFTAHHTSLVDEKLRHRAEK